MSLLLLYVHAILVISTLLYFDSVHIVILIGIHFFFLYRFVNNFSDAQENDPNFHYGICNAGDIIYVPHGWFHCVLNLDFTIALTQNFVGPENLLDVLTFLKTKPDQVSGYKGNDLYHDFSSKFEESYPGLIKRMESEKKVQNESNAPKIDIWENLKARNSTDNEPFTFQFAI